MILYGFFIMSFPAMGTWIEIEEKLKNAMIDYVVPCNGNVD